MLLRLALRNFVFSRHLEVNFSSGFCVLTGETGTGKSLLIDTMSLLLGGQLPATLSLADATSEVEATFCIEKHTGVKQWLREKQLEDEEAQDMLHIRRVFAAGSRRSTSYVNGRQVPLAQLSGVVSLLMDICGQHMHYSLLNVSVHRDLLDTYAQVDRQSVITLYKQYKESRMAWEEMCSKQDQVDLEKQVLIETLTELEELDFSRDKWEKMNALLTKANHTTDLVEGCDRIINYLERDNDGVLGRLVEIGNDIRRLSRHDEKLATMQETVEDIMALLNDINRDLVAYAETLNFDPKDHQMAENFIAECLRLSRKYGLSAPEQLEDLITEKQTLLHTLPSSQYLQELEQNVLMKRQALEAECAVLTKKRNQASSQLESRVNALLKKLGMMKAQFFVQLTSYPEPTAHGAEKIEFLIRTRDDMPAGTIANVASGGELSRLGLAIQVSVGSIYDKVISVFDEIDNGIGGAPADEVGRLLKTLGQSRQVLCVTHLPQVAANADFHFLVSGGEAIDVISLSFEQRIEELARMQSGVTITESARRHAKEMLDKS